MPQWTTTYLRDRGTNKFSVLHKTCWVLSPGMPQFSALYGLKYFFHTVWYLLRPTTIESPIKIALKDVMSLLEYHDCYVFYDHQLCCYVQLVLLLGRMIDCICSFWRHKMQWYATATIAIHGLWLSTNTNFVGNFFEVYFAEYFENGQTFSTFFLPLLAPRQVL